MTPQPPPAKKMVDAGWVIQFGLIKDEVNSCGTFRRGSMVTFSLASLLLTSDRVERSIHIELAARCPRLSYEKLSETVHHFQLTNFSTWRNFQHPLDYRFKCIVTFIRHATTVDEYGWGGIDAQL